MQNNLKVTPRKGERKVYTFDPPGAMRSMIANELRGKSRGALRRLLEHCVIETLGPKYPKLAERYHILREEKP